jgi:hypothetical protein
LILFLLVMFMKRSFLRKYDKVYKYMKFVYFMKEGLKKRGQGGIGLNMFVAILVLVIIVVLAIVFFTGGFGKIKEATDVLPEKLEFKVQSCIQVLKNDLSIKTYCDDFEEITDGGNEYVSCDYSKLRDALRKAEAESDFVLPKCDSSKGAVDKCKEIRNDKLKNNKQFDGNKFLMNGVSCSNLGVSDVVPTCNEMGGVPTPTSADRCDKMANGKTEVLETGEWSPQAGQENEICCVAQRCQDKEPRAELMDSCDTNTHTEISNVRESNSNVGKKACCLKK